MLTQADRASERRHAKLEELQRPAREDTLRIGETTAGEPLRHPTMPAKARRK
jgi:hypothetical protein